MFVQHNDVLEYSEITTPYAKFNLDLSILIIPYHCPYCLYKTELRNFVIHNKKGISNKRMMCPDCHNTMRVNTLIRNDTLEEYIKWLQANNEYNYLHGKIKWEKIKERLKTLGIANKFWNTWYRIKAESEPKPEPEPEYPERWRNENTIPK